jgi:hypothetical protein
MKQGGRPRGYPKSGGRKKGVPNKTTLAFKDALGAKGFSIPEKAIHLYETAQGDDADQLRLEILKFLASYTHSKPKVELEHLDGRHNPYLKLTKSEFIASLPVIDVEAQPPTT